MHIVLVICDFIVFFFFSSRRRHTRYWRDWSSDVCSSDLCLVRRVGELAVVDVEDDGVGAVLLRREPPGQQGLDRLASGPREDRKSVGEGKSVDLGGRRIIKKKKKNTLHASAYSLSNTKYT